MATFHPDRDRRARLGVPVGIPAEVLDAIVGTFHRRHPGLALRLVDLDTEQQVVALRTGAIDVGLVREPVDPGLALLPLLAEPFGVVLRDDDPLTEHDALELADVVTRLLIWWHRSQATGFHDEITAACVAAGGAPTVVAEAGDVVGALNRVAAGYGLHWMPEVAFHRHAQGLPRLRWRPIRGEPIVMRTSAAWLPTAAPTTARTAVLDVIRAQRSRSVRAGNLCTPSS